MKKLSGLLLLLFSTHVFACGYPEWYFNKYWESDRTAEEKLEVLNNPECGIHTNYFPQTADPVIAKVLVDAIQNDFPRESIERALRNFHCVYGARSEPEYETIRSFITEERYSEFCNVERLNRIFIVTANSGAILRAGPSVNTERLDAIREGDFVEVIADNGEWLKVKTLNWVGYMHSSLVSRY